MRSFSMKRMIYFIILLLFIITLYFMFKYNTFIPCLFHKITNLYCPGCGNTRMVIELLKGNFYQSFRYNILTFIFLPVYLFYGINFIVSYFKNTKALLYKIPSKYIYFMIFIYLLFGILRNIYPELGPVKI